MILALYLLFFLVLGFSTTRIGSFFTTTQRAVFPARNDAGGRRKPPPGTASPPCSTGIAARQKNGLSNVKPNVWKHFVALAVKDKLRQELSSGNGRTSRDSSQSIKDVRVVLRTGMPNPKGTTFRDDGYDNGDSDSNGNKGQLGPRSGKKSISPWDFSHVDQPYILQAWDELGLLTPIFFTLAWFASLWVSYETEIATTNVMMGIWCFFGLIGALSLPRQGFPCAALICLLMMTCGAGWLLVLGFSNATDATPVGRFLLDIMATSEYGAYLVAWPLLCLKTWIDSLTPCLSSSVASLSSSLAPLSPLPSYWRWSGSLSSIRDQWAATSTSDLASLIFKAISWLFLSALDKFRAYFIAFLETLILSIAALADIFRATFVNRWGALGFVSGLVPFLVYTCVRPSYRSYDELTDKVVIWCIQQAPAVRSALGYLLRELLSLVIAVVIEVVTKAWLALQNLLGHLSSDWNPAVQGRLRDLEFKTADVEDKIPHYERQTALAKRNCDELINDTDEELTASRLRIKKMDAIKACVDLYDLKALGFGPKTHFLRNDHLFKEKIALEISKAEERLEAKHKLDLGKQAEQLQHKHEESAKLLQEDSNEIIGKKRAESAQKDIRLKDLEKKLKEALRRLHCHTGRDSWITLGHRAYFDESYDLEEACKKDVDDALKRPWSDLSTANSRIKALETELGDRKDPDQASLPVGQLEAAQKEIERLKADVETEKKRNRQRQEKHDKDTETSKENAEGLEQENKALRDKIQQVENGNVNLKAEVDRTKADFTRLWKDRSPEDRLRFAFPKGHTTITTPSEGGLCGYNALHLSLRALGLDVNVPTRDELMGIWRRPELQADFAQFPEPREDGMAEFAAEAYVRFDQLARVAQVWGQDNGMHVVLCMIQDGTPNPKPYVSDDVSSGSTLVWIHHNGVEGLASHYSGIRAVSD